jgi:hypothetical protein
MLREKKRMNPLVIGGRVFNYMDAGFSNPMQKSSVFQPVSRSIFTNSNNNNNKDVFSFLKKKIEKPDSLLCNQVAVVKKAEDKPEHIVIFLLGFGLGYLFRSAFLFR